MKIEKNFFPETTKSLILIILPILAISKLHFGYSLPIIDYTIIWIISSLIYLFAIRYLLKNELSDSIFFTGLFLSFFLYASFIASTPVGSDDIFRYMWDGKVQNAGINPYLYTPTDQHLNFLHSKILPDKMNFPEMKTIYFPLSQWLFYLGFKLGGETFWAYKLLLFFFGISTWILLYKILALLKIEKKYLLIYTLSPLPIVQFALDAHLDGFGLPLLLAFLYYYLNNKKILSAIFLGLSFSIKPVGIIFLPILFLKEKKILNKAIILIVPLVAFGIQFVPYIFSTNPFEAFLIYTKNWIYNGLIFNLLNSLIHNNQTTRTICSALLIVFLIPVYFSKKNFLDKIYFAVMLLMIFSPVVHPWYITWVLILVAITKKWSGIYFTAAASLTSLTILNYQLYGVWKDFMIVQLIEYLPAISLLIYEYLKSENENKPTIAI